MNKMSDISQVSEDAGIFKQMQNEPESNKRRYSIGKSEDKPRRLSIQTDSPKLSIIISPEDVPDEYEHSEKEAGLLVIFNHETFQTHDDRKGTLKDQRDLVDCLSRLRYEIRKEFLFMDLTKVAIEEQLSKIAKMDHSKRSSLIIVFLTHGDAQGKLYSSDGFHITCEEVWNYFSAANCPGLSGKPKIFIFQACKGDQKSSLQKVQEDSMRKEAVKKAYTLPAEADILVAYSTVEGNVSYRNEESGSWFIQELCKNFTAYGRRDDMVSIITRVSKCVAYHYQHMHYKQMPCFISTLTRKFFLCKSKERGYLLDLNEQYKQLISKMEKLEQQLAGCNDDKKEEDRRSTARKTTFSCTPMKKASASTTKLNIPEKPRWR